MNEQSVILITGGSEGLGFACANALLAKGHTVCLLARSEEKLHAAQTRLEQTYDTQRIFCISADVSDPAATHKAAQEILRRFGKIDVLINAAGCSMHQPAVLEEVSTEDYLRIMRTNTDGTFFMTQAVLPSMKAHNSGFILNILSTAAHSAGSGNSPYSASKFAALAITDTLAAECQGTGVRISSVSPGPIATTIWSHKATPPSEEQKAKMLKPTELADILLFILERPANVHLSHLQVTPWYF